jgi:hypothetical protein
MIVSMYSRQTRVDCDVSKRYNNRRSLAPNAYFHVILYIRSAVFAFCPTSLPLHVAVHPIGYRCWVRERAVATTNGMTLSLSGTFWRLLRVFSAPLWQSGMACGCLSTRKVSSAELGGVEKCWGSGVELRHWPRSGGGIRWFLTSHLSFLQLSKVNHRQEKLYFE